MRKKRLRLSAQDRQYVLAFFVVATVVTSGLAYLTLTPPRKDEFYAMWILGSGGKAENYYPKENATLKVNQVLNWTLGVYNHMGSLQYAVIRVKLLNSTIASPNSSLGIPTPVTPLLEFRRVLLDNETWSMSFTWRILSLAQVGESIVITGLSIGESVFTGQLASAVSGFNFRFVFELWFYSELEGDLVFFWEVQNSRRSVWTQMWFNATIV